MQWLAGILAVGVLGWVGYSYLTVHTLGEPQYVISEARDGYEIRDYESFIVAETDVNGDIETALKEGFIVLEDYLTGDNLTLTTIPLKLPIMQRSDIAGRHVVQVVMPRNYAVAQLPRPNNPEVRLRMIPARTVAVLRFSWWASPARIDEQKRELVEILTLEGIQVAGTPHVAFYEKAMTVPYEIIVPIRVVKQ
ncbi:MAG: heme-binding protein [Candidatus Pacebacteria bacterium]|nr:heme-binding protein [Candidatus Paceibacterota bacterium]